jgi:methylmalonyl-CoA mutase N-terminal domain/subunit
MEISDAAYKFQQQIDAKKKVVVGVNKYVEENEKVDIPMVEIDESVEKEQLKRLADVKRQRDGRQVSKCLKDLESACKKGENVMPYCIEAVKAYATVEEICNVYRDVYGEYRDPGIY